MEQAICQAIEPLMEQHGFWLHTLWGCFVRPQPYGHDSLVVTNKRTASPVVPRHEIAVHCAVRHDSIEIPWNTLGLVFGEANQRRTDTLMLGEPSGAGAPVLTVNVYAPDEGISHAASAITAFFFTAALPFYRQFAEVSEIEELANREPLADLTPYSIGGPLEHRATRSLLLAKAAYPARYNAVREAIADLGGGLIPRERRVELLRRVAALQTKSFPEDIRMRLERYPTHDTLFGLDF